MCNRGTGFSAVAVALTAGVVMLQIRSKQISAQSREKCSLEKTNDETETDLFGTMKLPSDRKGLCPDSLETFSMEDSIEKLETDSFTDSTFLNPLAFN
jgi:hypothetical protein